MYSPEFHKSSGTRVAQCASLVLLLAPAVVLTAAAAKYGEALLAAGAVAGVLGGSLAVRQREAWRPPTSGAASLLYLFALAALWAASWDVNDPFARFGRGLFLAGAVALMVGHDLHRTGLGPRRHARIHCRRLTRRTNWPERLEDYYRLPEVRGLADALQDDPTPALELLNDPRPQVRATAFLVLQGRPHWRAVDAASVLSALRQTTDPAVRSLAITALATADDHGTVAELAAMLRDPSPVVRTAAASAVLSGGGRRWPLVRDDVREALTDLTHANDVGLADSAGRLSAMAVCDLNTWAAEGEPLGSRAIRTLVGHYAALLRAGGQPELPAALAEMATDAQTPAALRVELAGLLRDFGYITPELLDRMTDVDQPGPVRLLAAEALLASEPDHPDALDVLRGLARQPNRETALAIARILQTQLQLDMGLPSDGERVLPTSKVGLEAAKRVLAWATGGRPELLGDLGKRSKRPLSTPTLSGLHNVSDKPMWSAR